MSVAVHPYGAASSPQQCTIDTRTALAAQITTGNLLLTVAFVYSLVFVIKKRVNGLSPSVQRYEFYALFYGLIFAALASRMAYFLVTLLVFEGALDESAPSNVQPSDVLYNLFLNLPVMFMLLLTIMVCFTWYGLIVKVKFPEAVAAQYVHQFKRRSTILFSAITVAYCTFTISEMVVPQGGGEQTILGQISYFGNKATVACVYVAILAYVAAFGSKMIRLLAQIEIIQEKCASEQRAYRVNLYLSIVLAGTNVVLYVTKIIVFAALHVPSFESAVCEASGVVMVIIQMFDYGVLELWPIMIYQQFLIPVEGKKDANSVAGADVSGSTNGDAMPQNGARSNQNDDDDDSDSDRDANRDRDNDSNSAEEYRPRRRSSGEMITSAQAAWRSNNAPKGDYFDIGGGGGGDDDRDVPHFENADPAGGNTFQKYAFGDDNDDQVWPLNANKEMMPDALNPINKSSEHAQDSYLDSMHYE